MWQRLVLSLLVLSCAGLAADDGWSKVMRLGSGTEVRVLKIGGRFGIVATLSETTEESVIVTTKTEQLSIPKEQIAKIEYVPATAPPPRRVTRSSSVDNLPVDKEAARPKPGPARTPGPTGSSSTTYSRSSSKPAYETIWTRPRPN